MHSCHDYITFHRDVLLHIILFDANTIEVFYDSIYVIQKGNKTLFGWISLYVLVNQFT